MVNLTFQCCGGKLRGPGDFLGSFLSFYKEIISGGEVIEMYSLSEEKESSTKTVYVGFLYKEFLIIIKRRNSHIYHVFGLRKDKGLDYYQSLLSEHVTCTAGPRPVSSL